jgi:hypothetical protein
MDWFMWSLLLFTTLVNLAYIICDTCIYYASYRYGYKTGYNLGYVNGQESTADVWSTEDNDQ